MPGCEHQRTELLMRRDGIDYMRCLDCDQVFEAEDLRERQVQRSSPPRKVKIPETALQFVQSFGRAALAGDAATPERAVAEPFAWTRIRSSSMIERTSVPGPAG